MADALATLASTWEIGKQAKNEKEVRGFIGRLQYISRFIAKLTTICEPRSRHRCDSYLARGKNNPDG